MQVTKFLHSCLLIKDANTTVLIDPGSFTYEEKVLDLSQLVHLDYLLLTHEHPDHFYLPLVREIVHKFSQVKIITNPAIVTLLATYHIKATTEGNDLINVEHIMHAKLWDKDPIPNTVFTIRTHLTHPGDSHSFTNTSEILALPLQAPWGSTAQAVAKALEVKPKVIIPIHDWQWKDEVRIAMYERLEKFFETKGIMFVKMETGKKMEIAI